MSFIAGRTPFKDVFYRFSVLKMGTLEEKIREALLSTVNVYSMDNILKVFDDTMTDKSSEFNLNIEQVVSNDSEKIYLKSDMHDFKGRVTIINDSSKNFTDSFLHSLLQSQIKNFDATNSYYKKFPILSVVPLFVLYAYVYVFDKLVTEKRQDVAKQSQLTCDLHRVLLDYRNLTVVDRLKLVNISGTGDLFVQDSANKIKNEQISNILSLSYNDDGYNGKNATSIDCKRIEDWKRLDQEMMYMKDDENGYYINTDNFSHCIEDYMKYARYRVERFFDEMLEKSKLSCATKIKPHEKVPTGNL